MANPRPTLIQFILPMLLAAGIAAGARGDSPPSASGAKDYLLEQVSILEKEIAERDLDRPGAKAADLAMLDLQIDMRIVARWALLQAASREEGDAQACAWLRGQQCINATASAETALKQMENLSRSQSESLIRLHQLSYNLGDAKDLKQIDDVCRNVGALLLNITSATPVDFKTAVTMRPKPLTTAAEVATPDDQAGQRTLAQVTEECRQIAISVPLRQQLLAIAAQVASLAEEKGQQKEYSDLFNVLLQSVDLAKGLASNTAISGDNKVKIESQLARGLALYADSRTRSAGQARIDALSQYRQILTRVGRMQLTAEQRGAVGPAFQWAQENPEPGGKVMTAIERFVALTVQYDAMKLPAPPENQRKTVDELKKQFEAARADFLTDAAQFGKSTVSPGPDDLQQHADDLARNLHVLEQIGQLPATIDTLLAYKPKPAGLERKLTLAATATAGNVKTLSRADAIAMLDVAAELARWSRTLNEKRLDDVPADIAARWTGAAEGAGGAGGGSGQLDAFGEKWKSIVTELASQLAAGTDFDTARMRRLESASNLIDQLHVVAALAQTSRRIELLQRWADWTIGPEELQVVLTPYKDGITGAFTAFVTDTSDGLDRWMRIQKRYAPLIVLLIRAGQYADQCEKLPHGADADAYKLLTPLDAQPFASERYASFAVALWVHNEATDEPSAADQAAINLARRLNHDLQLGLKNEDFSPPPHKPRPRFDRK